MPDFKVNELIIYQNGNRFEIGKIKRLCDDGAFVYYHTGQTAAKTPYDLMHKLTNAYCITSTCFGGNDEWKHLINELDYYKHEYYSMCDLIESSSGRVDLNKPLKWDDLRVGMWIWDNVEREYKLIDLYDDCDEIYWLQCVNTEMHHKLFNDELEEGRYFRYEVKQ